MNGNGTSMIDKLSIIGSTGYLHGYLERGETR
jgi:hypothetical protein